MKLSSCLVAFALATGGVAATLAAQDKESPKEAYERVVVAESIMKLKNSEIEWKGFGFAVAPVTVGKHARQMQDVSVKYAGDLLALLENEDTFIVAHVLLTRLWRVSQSEKEHICILHSEGYVVVFNGLVAKLDGRSATYPDLDQQQKRIGFWWKARYRDFPREFSPKTLVD